MFWVISRFDLQHKEYVIVVAQFACVLRSIVNCSKDEPADIVYEIDVFYRVHSGT